MPSTQRHIGEFCWINLLTPDPVHDREFYAGLLRWSYRDIPGMEIGRAHV